MNDVDERVRALRPDALTEDAHRRRREADLARAFAEAGPRSRTTSRHLFRPGFRPGFRLTPRVALVGALVGLAAAVTVPAVVTGTIGLRGPGGGRTAELVYPDRTSTGSPAATPGTPVVTLDARSFLLAGAETAAREAAPKGRYWFERTRTFEPVGSGAVVAHTDEFWHDGRSGRSSSNQDVQVTFETASDEAAWKAKGSPSLWPGPKTEDFSMVLGIGIGAKTLNLGEEQKLPGDVEGLERWLRSAHREGPFADFAFEGARHLLSMPTNAATRASMLRILAAQPGLVLKRGVLDPIGRTGTAVTTANGHRTLVIDESGARLLAFRYDGPDEKPRAGTANSVFIPARKGFKVAYESSGWVGELGIRK
ncbi:hypothetical protein OIE13_03540 [Streptosporangium sp. NBC_01810]|uniref:hypothetical protein n=1 Tax=Streptosporangium sp. NBC_01810 TaxID=2975951 RepID=UPI002DDB6A4B|nr:hypothetical protein [Streptosporangium sp. NBC_01810]WSA26979.1 hypothetical protein OIE13_03540 [Streptosporangium sp. NBC_01810]